MGITFKRTKILATVGPSVDSEAAISNLITAGANGFRLNFSHGNYAERDQQIWWIRTVSERLKKPVAIVQDLQGPKIRLGELDGEVVVKKGDELILDFFAKYAYENDGKKVLPVQYNLGGKVKPGERLYIFDGRIKSYVVGIAGEGAVQIKIENGGVITSKKGINLPDTDFAGDIMTEKDLADIEYGVRQDIDFVALSFVQSAEDVNSLRQHLTGLNSEAQVIAKIETRAAIRPEVLEEIVKASDGVMVARGDLAVEAGAEVVPVVQKQVIGLCRRYGKLSIVATQMMASMVDSPEPTRAEVNDVATAVIQGADTVMLSEETANGNYPFEVVAAMKKTILYTQEHSLVAVADDVEMDNQTQDAISGAAVKLAEQLETRAIIAETKKGATAVNIAAYRPNLPIISVTSVPRTAQQLSLSYATKSFIRPDSDRAGLDIAKELKDSDFFGDGKAATTVVIVSGRSPGLSGATDTIKVRVLK